METVVANKVMIESYAFNCSKCGKEYFVYGNESIRIFFEESKPVGCNKCGHTLIVVSPSKT